MEVDYPKEWDELPKRERKKKIKELKKKETSKKESMNKLRNFGILVIVLIVAVFGYRQLTKKTPEEIEFEEAVESVSLEENNVEEFDIEGADHIPDGQTAEYQTNPPTSGSHYAAAADWGYYETELPDERLVHNLEHGGIWISYKEVDDETLAKLEEISKKNPGSVIVTKRDANDSPIVVASWGKYMKMGELDEPAIQKYIDTYINNSPERLAL